MSRSTFSTAESQLVGLPKTSLSTGNRFVSPRTDRSAPSAEGCGVVAAEFTVSACPSQLWMGLDAARDPVRTARVEAARGRELGELRHAARDHGQIAAAAREARHRAEQALRV